MVVPQDSVCGATAKSHGPFARREATRLGAGAGAGWESTRAQLEDEDSCINRLINAAIVASLVVLALEAAPRVLFSDDGLAQTEGVVV